MKISGIYDIVKLNELLDTFNFKNFKSIELLVNFENGKLKISQLKELVFRCARVTKVVFLNSLKEKLVTFNDCAFIYLEESEILKACGKIYKTSFSPNIVTYTESLYFNSCLNRKISIDLDGNIKNCPSMSKSYGNIRDTALAEVIEKSGFKDMWDINKDKIHVCKDCKYRYICTDCRAYVEDPDDILSKPLKCGYNPYTGEWSEWSTNPLKQKAIEFYGMRDILPKADA